MNRRTVYLQEILQASDFLWAQKYAMEAIAIQGQLDFGIGSCFSPIPPGANISAGLGPGLSYFPVSTILYQQHAFDTSAWPISGPPIISVDSTTVSCQGYIFSPANPVVWASPAPGNGSVQYYVLVQGQVQTIDQNVQHLPFYPLIQTTTTGSSSTTSVLHVADNTGFSPGDLILVQGYPTVSGAPAIVLSLGATTIINLDGTDPTRLLASAPNLANISVRDLVPNDGLPLDGINNDGLPLSTDRVNTIAFSAVVGAAAASPIRPSATAGWVPMWYLGPFLGSTTTTTGFPVNSVNCPLLPPRLGANHHRRADAVSAPTVVAAYPGNANPIDLITETTYIPLNTAGGTMLGELFCNATPTSIHTTGDITSAGSVAASGNVSATGNLSGGTSTLGSLTVQGNTILNNLAGTTAIHGIAQFFSTVLLPYDPSVALQAATKQYTDGYIGVGAYTGNGSTQQSISTGFAPRVGIVFPTSPSNAESVWILLTNTVLRLIVNTATSNVWTVGVAPSTAVLTLSGVGLLTGTSGANSANVGGEVYFWLVFR